MGVCKRCEKRDYCEKYQNNLKETGRVLFGCSEVPAMDALKDYESPITMKLKEISQQIIEHRENSVMLQIEEQVGVSVDKNELIRALQNDRNQYKQGYKNGYKQGYEDGSPIISTKPAVATDGWGHELEGYFDESRQMFFCKAITREFLISTGWNIKLEEEQLRGKTDGGEEQ